MKKLIFSLLPFAFHFSLFTCSAQNLVPNPSFEDYTLCPDNQCQIYRTTGWQSFGYTPDYYNACAISNWSVPQNIAGYQYAATGNAYVGIYTYWPSNNAREYIGIQLTTPLVKNQKYYVSFKANFTKYIFNCATSKLGVLFSTVSYALDTNCNFSTLLFPPNHAHIYENSVLTDTANWTLVSGSFVADSSYKYIIIGNFFDNAHTDTIKYDSNPCIAYYFIDDIYVGKNPEGLNEINHSNDIINIYPNPAIDKIEISSGQDAAGSLEIYNLLGEKVYANSNNKLQTTNKIDVSAFPIGVYVVEVRTEKGIEVRKFVKE
jgi:hypothetical protein